MPTRRGLAGKQTEQRRKQLETARKMEWMQDQHTLLALRRAREGISGVVVTEQVWEDGYLKQVRIRPEEKMSDIGDSIFDDGPAADDPKIS